MLTFLSDSLASAPRFRLTSTKEDGGKVGIAFDMAQPGKDFTNYTQGTARRK